MSSLSINLNYEENATVAVQRKVGPDAEQSRQTVDAPNTTNGATADVMNTVSRLSFEQFLRKTNITELILAYLAEKGSVPVSDRYLHLAQAVQFRLLKDKKNWSEKLLKDLKLVDVGNRTPMPPPDSRCAGVAPHPNYRPNHDTPKLPAPRAGKKNRAVYKPTEFQKLIAGMSLKEFRDKTNIYHILEHGPIGYWKKAENPREDCVNGFCKRTSACGSQVLH